MIARPQDFRICLIILITVIPTTLLVIYFRRAELLQGIDINRLQWSSDASVLKSNLYQLWNSQSASYSASENQSKEAYATFLSTRVQSPWEEDNYYNSTRLLVYQLLHDQKTRDSYNRGVVVMVTKNVADWKVDRLRKDGATVKVVDNIEAPTKEGLGSERWIDMFTKLRLWEFEEYNRLFFLDCDHLLIRNLTFVWDLDATSIVAPANSSSYILREEDEKLEQETLGTISSYAFSGVPDPHLPQDVPTLNGGIFIMKPCKIMFKRLTKIMEEPAIFGGVRLAEQNLFNYAFRVAGPYPWRKLPDGIDDNQPSGESLNKGFASMHDKYWEDRQDADFRLYGYKLLGKMEGHYLGLEADKNKPRDSYAG